MLPTHIGIIMDGNRRWAKEHNLPTFEGHRKGLHTAFKIVAQEIFEKGIPYLTVFAFSTENWKRSKEEVSYLMNLFKQGIKNEIKQFIKKGICFRIMGRRDAIPKDVLVIIEEAEEKTKHLTKGFLQIAFNYGGRQEVVDAVKQIVKKGVKKIDESVIQKHLYLPDIPDPDLIIRTSGEQRLSGFLLWQASYAELFFTKKHWPEFGKEDLEEALEVYANRERRYGGDSKK